MLNFGGLFTSKPVIFSLIFFGVAFLSLWIASVFWVYQDIFNRSKNVVLQILSIACVILFPLLGLIVYGFIRPGHTLDERRLLLLDEKIMRQEVGELLLCPSCRKGLETDYVYCPNCKTKVKETCAKCNKVIDKKFKICPFCCHSSHHEAVVKDV